MLTQVDIRQLPSYSIGYEDGEARGEAKGEARGEALIVRRLLTHLDAEKVAVLLGLSTEEVARIVAKGDPDNPHTE